jgi:glutamine synthetase
VLPEMPMHGGDRNRTSPFAFTGNKFEFRALGSSMSLGFVNTVLNTIVAESVDALASTLEKQLKASKGDLGAAVSAVVKQVWEGNSQIVFDGDNYTDEWHAEASKRGLKNLRTTPDALPWFVNKQTVSAFEKYKVLSKRELDARYEVALEQYAVKLNIEAETAASIARTMILPAAARHVADLRTAGLDAAVAESEGLLDELWTAIGKLENANLAENQPDEEPLQWSKYMRDKVIPAMGAVRDVADRLERVVADDLWPLPKYSEMLFIK